ncbi:carboxylesterase 4A [Anthonomus grandis grandis]|uniref:carboxylesterase 4A n=1 Tax=Anthonomus grandis grandis TaxID=2921223 RepID=UPI0021657D00|nr:carboxylesterase 4A [Anthonomus grandis grandis]
MIKLTLLILFYSITSTLASNVSNISPHHRVRRIVGGEVANYPPFDDPVVYVRFNGKSARVQGSREYPHYVFKGIKYAQPPVGPDRFLRPKEKFLEGEVRATVYSPPCIQPVPGKNFILGTEDCLALNIFTPDLPRGTEGLPVIIWIHGGGFRYGSASQYGVKHLVGQRLVVVTIQYRLGSLGFLSTGTRDLPGNAALWDMALAVQWVRNYIGFFGGNPHRIIVMGHDTGASSALLLSLTKIAKGMPNAVVAMSGTAVSRWAIDNTPSNTATDIAEQNGCPTKNPVIMVKCLQKVPAESIIKGDSAIEFQRLQSRGFTSGLNGRLGTAPVAEGANDGRSLPGYVEYDPVDQLYRQENPRIPLLTGVTKDETKKAVTGQYRNEIITQLSSIPNFLNKVLVEHLQDSPVISKLSGRLGNIGNISGALISNGEKVLKSIGIGQTNILEQLPLNFDNYLKTKKNDIASNLDKISEVTSDALFNVPAFLTAQFWKGASTFLYSFEHKGNMNRGSSFLRGLPLIGNSSSESETKSDTSVSHGAELAYLFDANDIEGNPLPLPQPTEDDVKVRKVFTKMIADFARHGSITVENKKVPPFNVGDNNFIQIKPTPVLANKFKFCEMALWTNIGQRLKDQSCKFLGALEAVGVQNVLQGLKGSNLGNIQNIGGLLGGQNTREDGNTSPKVMMGKGGLGSLLG